MTARNYGLVTSLDELAQFQHKLITTGEPFGFDIETGYTGPDKEKFSLHPETAIVVGFSFTNDTTWARYVPLRHDTGDNLDSYAVAELLWPLLATGRAVVHNAPFELRHLSRWFREYLTYHPEHGEAVRAAKGYFPVRSCTQVEAYLCADLQSFGLKALTRVMFDRRGQLVPREEWNGRVKQLDEIVKIKDVAEREAAEAAFDGHRMTELHELFPDLPVNRRKMLRFNVLDPADPQVVDYACEDALWALALHRANYHRVVDQLLYRVEMGVLDCVCEMEDVGVRYDWAHMARGAEELRGFRDRFNAEIMTELSTLIGEPTAINLASSKQVGEVLFTKLGYRTTVYTAGTKDKPADQRKMSTGAIALAGLAKKKPVVKKVLQWKEMTRLLGTYLDKYEGLYGYAEDGHTHPNHLSAVVVTGRFAVADPPYQQSPKVYHFDLEPGRAAHAAHADAHGRDCECDDPEFAPPPGTCFRFNFRDAIVAPPDCYILGFDLSMAELRAIAGEAGETALLDAFAAGTDVHKLTAALMLRVPLDQVTKDQRDVGKTMNFALLYGMQAKSLGERLGIATDEAQALYDKFFSAYPAIAVWAERQVRHGTRHGYVTSRFGRKLPIWEYQSDRHWIRTKGDRACVNYPIQGCLPADTRVLTRGGWVPIGAFEDGTDVWTGGEWAPALRLDMGAAPRVRLHLSDGRTFDCDDRHRVLVKADPWPQWKLVTEAKGLPLCQDHHTDWGVADASSVEDWYWVGRFVGDGSLHRTNQGNVRWNMSFDGVKETEDIDRFQAWLGVRFKGGTNSKTGYHVDRGAARRGLGKGVQIIGGSKAGVAFWQAHGIQVGDRAKTLRVPPQVFQLDRARREAFCEGYLDADGNARHSVIRRDGTTEERAETYWSKLTSASRAGLEDMLRLFQTIGRTGRIGNPVTLAGRGAGGTDHVFWDLWLHRAPKELTIVDYEVLPAEPMYTLSVDHPRHSFSSEGLISKNSATGDYMKIAMVRARKAIRAAGLAEQIRLVMNVHDALEFYVDRDIRPEQAIALLHPAVVFAVPGEPPWPAMAADWHIAKRWGSPIEVVYDPATGAVHVKGEKPAEVTPAVEADEDTGEEVEVLPDVDLDTLRSVAAGLAQPPPPPTSPDRVVPAAPAFSDVPDETPGDEDRRRVIITVTDMPTEAAFTRFLTHARGHPGPHALTLRTPDGDLPLHLPAGSAIGPADTPTVAMMLGQATVSFDTADVDPEAVVAGLSL